MKQLFRYEDVTYAASIDEFGNHYGDGRVDVVLRAFEIISTTPKGVWISYGFGGKDKFVNLSCKKKYACETLDGAKESFLKRKEAQHRILSAQLKRVNSAINLMKFKFNDNP